MKFVSQFPVNYSIILDENLYLFSEGLQQIPILCICFKHRIVKVNNRDRLLVFLECIFSWLEEWKWSENTLFDGAWAAIWGSSSKKKENPNTLNNQEKLVVLKTSSGTCLILPTTTLHWCSIVLQLQGVEWTLKEIKTE